MSFKMNLYLFIAFHMIFACRCQFLDTLNAPVVDSQNAPLTATINTSSISNAILLSLKSPIEKLIKSSVNKSIEINMDDRIRDAENRVKKFSNSELKLLRETVNMKENETGEINKKIKTLQVADSRINQKVLNMDDLIQDAENRVKGFCKSELKLQQETVKSNENEIGEIIKTLALNMDTVRDLIKDAEIRVKDFGTSELKLLRQTVKNKENEIMEVNKKLETLQAANDQIKQKVDCLVDISQPTDCVCIDTKKGSGIYTIFPGHTAKGIQVFCDMETDGGGWTVFQRRRDGSTDFFRGWLEYENGFGDLQKEFWLGNSNLHSITSQGKYELRIDMEDFENNTRFAKYSTFSVGGKGTNYILTVDGYSGDARDSLSYHNGAAFSTKDRDNDGYDGNCAQLYKGGWWYSIGCHLSNINGLYLKGKHSSYADGINWSGWKGYKYSLKSTTMMTRKVK